MCIVIVNEKGLLPDEYIQNSWEGNGDGAGICFIEDGKVKIEKFPSTMQTKYYVA
jgi:hypothetical protein